MRVKEWITNNLGLKVVSLALAIATWSYINLELTKIKNEEERAIISMLHYNIISKKIPIRLTIVGEAREGYELVADAIDFDPDIIVIVGPESILNEVNFARTIPIDISEYTKDIIKQVELAPIARGITLKDSLVDVNIPIIKKQEEADKSSK